MKEHQKTLYLVQGALIAALYVVLTLVAAGFDLASGAIQVRISEALCILPFFTPAAVPGLFVGCLVANLVTGSALPDIIFGSLATLLGALGTRALRKHSFLCSLPPVLSNMIIVPLLLTYAYHIPGGIPYFMLTVGAGEVLSICVFGEILLRVLKPIRGRVFGPSQEPSPAKKSDAV
ncbi:MAG: QueT transporter family protein [Lachnospiraceae bacterium]|nr:QueT transporter family protein [Lachnospiraceae bacterium]